MRRLLTVFVVATLLVLALAAPAFAARHLPPVGGGEPPNGNACNGAPHVPFDCEPN